MKYRKKMLLTEATQWLKNGDHPQDESVPLENSDDPSKLSEGKVVRRFRSLDIPGTRFCPLCGNVMQKHGILVGANGEEFVCPSDYIITDRHGVHHRMSRGEFESQYEPYVRPPRHNPIPVSDLEERLQNRKGTRDDEVS